MLADDEFLQEFRDCTLPPDQFDHRSHVRLGWSYLTTRPVEEAIEQVCEGIQRYAEHVGAGGKFHRTITEALMRLLASHLPAERELTWQELIEHNPVIVQDARGLLLRLYSEERLSSREARSSYVAPDRRPMPAQ